MGMASLIDQWRKEAVTLKLEAAEWDSHQWRYANWMNQAKMAERHANELAAAMADSVEGEQGYTSARV